MKKSIRVAFSLFAICVLVLPITQRLVAQDRASDNAPASGISTSKLDPHYRPPRTPDAGNLLYDNGPLVNNPGGGAGGADASVLQSSLSMMTLGFNHDPEEYHVADDFTVTDPSGWTIDSLVFYAYQTLSGNVSTMTALYYQIWDGPPDDPGSTVVFGDLTTNRLGTTGWSNTYRVTETTLLNTDRPVMRNRATGGAALLPGTYWIEWVTEGTLTSGPWAPPITINGQPTTGDALQYDVSAGTWAPMNDFGTLTPQGLPFMIYGQGSSSGNLTCGEISNLAARCLGSDPNFTVQWRLDIPNNRLHTGERVIFDVNGTQYVSTIESNRVNSRATGEISPAPVGTYTIALIDPPGCFPRPFVVTCGSAENADSEWEEAEVLWNGNKEQLKVAPSSTQNLGNFPNPFNPSTTFRYGLSEPGKVTLSVYDMLGQLVKTIVNDYQSEGYHEAIWDGRNEAGSNVASGMYVYRMTAGTFSATKRMLLLK